MTTYLTDLTDPNDTGEIINRTQLDKARTEIINLDTTRNLAPYIAQLPPPLRLADATGEMPALREMPYGFVPPEEPVEPAIWEAEVLDTGSYPPPKPLPKPKAGKHTWTGQVGSFPTVRPGIQRPGRGRHRAPRKSWTALIVGLLVVGASLGALVVLAVIR